MLEPNDQMQGSIEHACFVSDVDNCFSKVTPESEKCASAIMNITPLKDIQSIYPGSNFSYGQEEECG